MLVGGVVARVRDDRGGDPGIEQCGYRLLRLARRDRRCDRAVRHATGNAARYAIEAQRRRDRR